MGETVGAEHMARWASAVRRHIDKHAPFGGEVELVQKGTAARVTLWRNEARTRAFTRDMLAGDILDWGEHFIGELFGLLHKSIFAQGWHVSLPEKAPTHRAHKEEVVLKKDDSPAVVMAPIKLENEHPTTPLPSPINPRAIEATFLYYVALSSWPEEARLSLIDDGRLIEFSIEGDEAGRYRHTVSAQAFVEQELATITRFLSRYEARKKSDTKLGL